MIDAIVMPTYGLTSKKNMPSALSVVPYIHFANTIAKNLCKIQNNLRKQLSKDAHFVMKCALARKRTLNICMCVYEWLRKQT